MEDTGEKQEIKEKELEAQESVLEFSCGEMEVRLRFTEEGPGLAEILKDYFISLKQVR